MRDEDKPFICYKQGRWGMKIVPRNGEGWRALGLWMAVLALLTIGHIALVASKPDNAVFVGWATFGFIVIVGVWAIAMIRWMLARAEVINLDELLELKRERDRSKRRR